jgi:RHS repeat-associated protein
MAQILGHYRKAYPSGDTISEFFFNDNLSSKRVILNSSGVVQDKYSYKAWGEPIHNSGMTGEPSFTGKQYDITGLIYFNARYYDYNSGRFITEDPSKMGTGWYNYCDNNPINMIDDNGKEGGPVLTNSDFGFDSWVLAGDNFNGRVQYSIGNRPFLPVPNAILNTLGFFTYTVAAAGEAALDTYIIYKTILEPLGKLAIQGASSLRSSIEMMRAKRTEGNLNVNVSAKQVCGECTGPYPMADMAQELKGRKLADTNNAVASAKPTQNYIDVTLGQGAATEETAAATLAARRASALRGANMNAGQEVFSNKDFTLIRDANGQARLVASDGSISSSFKNKPPARTFTDIHLPDPDK